VNLNQLLEVIRDATKDSPSGTVGAVLHGLLIAAAPEQIPPLIINKVLNYKISPSVDAIHPVKCPACGVYHSNTGGHENG